MKWTEEQARAIDRRGSNILVSAAAGSGKTAVLVERIKKLILGTESEPPIPADKLLVVTFTDAAASEMRQKIIDALMTESEKSDSEHLRDQLRRIHFANISTFHAFALSIVKRYYFTIDLAPGFAVADDYRRKMLSSEALDKLFEECFDISLRHSGLVPESKLTSHNLELGHKARMMEFIEFLRHYATSKSEDAVRDMITDLHSFIMQMPKPFEWLDESVSNFSLDANGFAKTPAFRSLVLHIATELKKLSASLTSLVDFIETSGTPKLAAKFADSIEKMKRLCADADDLHSFLEDAQTGRDCGSGAAMTEGESGSEAAMTEGEADSGAAMTEGDFSARFDEVGRQIKEFPFPGLRTTNDEKEAYEAVKEAVVFRRDAIKKSLKRLGERFFVRSLADYVSDNNEIYPHANVLAYLVERYDKLYSEAKRREGLIDFTDFEHMALRILEDENICEEYRSKFEYIFIDEYQDTNYIQEELISRICRQDNMFMVGDVKQSIYQFRLAEPAIFIDKYRNIFSPSAESLNLNHSIDLNLNFRSKGSILSDINLFFKRLMRADLSGIDYDSKAALKKGIDYDALGYDGSLDLPVTLILADKKSEDEAATTGEDAQYGYSEDNEFTDKEAANDETMVDELADAKDAELEALIAAEEIAKAVSEGEFFDIKEGKVRPYRYRDIVILLREAQASAQIWYDTLQSRGIPAYINSGDGYFDTVEIETFLNLLKTIDNSKQDVPLVGTLYSPVFGFSLDDLAKIRIEHNLHLDDLAKIRIEHDKQDVPTSTPFYEAFHWCAEGNGPAELSEKCRDAKERIDSWRVDESFMTLTDFVWKLLKESGYYDYAGALPGGTLRRANLRAIADRVDSFTTSYLGGLFGFLRFVEDIKKKKMKAPQMKLFGEGDDAVRIMTVHKSKGLEFPFVIVGQIGKKLRGGAGSGRMDLHRKIGLGLQWENPERHTYRKTLTQQMIVIEKDREIRAEDLRVLYVAMTRAMAKLTLIGTTKDAKKSFARAQILAGEDYIDPMSTTTYLEMILPTLRSEGRDVKVYTPPELATILSGKSIDRSEPAKPSVDTILPHEASEEAPVFDEVNRRLSFVYPHIKDLTEKSKYGVTEINKEHKPERRYFTEGSEEQDREDAGTLSLTEETEDRDRKNLASLYSLEKSEAPSAAQRGTALHTVLERLDFKEAYAKRGELSYFESVLSGMQKDGYITPEQTKTIGPSLIQDYANTDLFARAAASQILRRETPFNLKYKHFGRDTIVQGIIDLWFAEGGKIVLVDYKSGRFRRDDPADAERVKNRYGTQIEIYRIALERITGREVSEAWLYMTDAGVAVRMH